MLVTQLVFSFERFSVVCKIYKFLRKLIVRLETLGELNGEELDVFVELV